MKQKSNWSNWIAHSSKGQPARLFSALVYMICAFQNGLFHFFQNSAKKHSKGISSSVRVKRKGGGLCSSKTSIDRRRLRRLSSPGRSRDSSAEAATLLFACLDLAVIGQLTTDAVFVVAAWMIRVRAADICSETHFRFRRQCSSFGFFGYVLPLFSGESRNFEGDGGRQCNVSAPSSSIAKALNELCLLYGNKFWANGNGYRWSSRPHRLLLAQTLLPLSHSSRSSITAENCKKPSEYCIPRRPWRNRIERNQNVNLPRPSARKPQPLADRNFVVPQRTAAWKA